MGREMFVQELLCLLAAVSLTPLDGIAWDVSERVPAFAHPNSAALVQAVTLRRTRTDGWRCAAPVTAIGRLAVFRPSARPGFPLSHNLHRCCTGRAVGRSVALGHMEGGVNENTDLETGQIERLDKDEPVQGGTDSRRVGSLGAKSEAAWPLMRNKGKIRDECKALLSESRDLVLRNFELAKNKWENALDTVEETGEQERIVTTYNLVLNLCALAATRGRADALETALDVMSRMVERGASPTLVSFNTLMNVCAKSAAAGLGEQAVVNAHDVLSMMEDAKIAPDAITFTSMLDACAKAAAFRGGRGGWTRGWQNGLSVLDLMRERGVGRTVMTYNVLISICVTGANTRREGVWVEEAVDRAVGVLATMRSDGVRPDSDTYNHLFTVCAKAAGAGYKEAATVAQQVFSDLSKEGLASEMGVETWNALVNTYAKCSNFTLAERLVSVEMPAAGVTPDRITWNTVMHAVANEAARGRLSGMQYGMQVLEMMKASGVAPDVRSFNSLLRACTATAWGRGSESVRPRGAWVMDLMRADGIEPDLITFTTVLDACVRAAREEEDGGRGEAMQVLQEMQKAGLSPNVVTCNCLLSACAKAAYTHGLVMVDNGLELLQKMKGLGVAPDIISFNTLISACSYSASHPQQGYRAGDALARGLLVMREMQAHGIEPNVVSFTSLLSAGSRAIKNEGDTTVLAQARGLVSLMRELGVRADVVTYTTMLDIYAKAAAQGHAGDWVGLSLQVLQDMRTSGVAPSGITCSVFVDTCVNSVGMLKGDTKGRSAQKRIRRIFDRLDSDGDGKITASELVQAPALLQRKGQDARTGRGSGDNVTSSDILRFIRMADQDGDGAVTYPEFERLIVDSSMPRGLGVLPKMGTERAVAEGRGFVTMAWKVMCDMLNMGIAVNINACNALLDATVVVGGLGPLGQGEETFDLCFEDASKIFWMMDKYKIAPNCRSYTALIKLCALGAANGVGERAIEKAFFIFHRMRDRGIAPDVVVFNTLIDAYAKAAWAGSGGGIGPALEVLELMKEGKVQPNTVTYTSLINAARHQGTHEAVTVALALFRKMPAISRNHQTYTVMMHALTRVGRRAEALSLLDEASSHGLQPNSFMMDAALQAAGRDRRQIRLLEERYGPSSQHERVRGGGIAGRENRGGRKNVSRGRSAPWVEEAGRQGSGGGSGVARGLRQGSGGGRQGSGGGRQGSAVGYRGGGRIGSLGRGRSGRAGEGRASDGGAAVVPPRVAPARRRIAEDLGEVLVSRDASNSPSAKPYSTSQPSEAMSEEQGSRSDERGPWRL